MNSRAQARERKAETEYYDAMLACDYPDDPDDDGRCPDCGASVCDECDEDCPSWYDENNR